MRNGGQRQEPNNFSQSNGDDEHSQPGPSTPTGIHQQIRNTTMPSTPAIRPLPDPVIEKELSTLPPSASDEGS